MLMVGLHKRNVVRSKYHAKNVQ